MWLVLLSQAHNVILTVCQAKCSYICAVIQLFALKLNPLFRFCKGCIDGVVNSAAEAGDNPSCPSCRESFSKSNVYRSRDTDKAIHAVQTQCTGCHKSVSVAHVAVAGLYLLHFYAVQLKQCRIHVISYYQMCAVVLCVCIYHFVNLPRFSMRRCRSTSYVLTRPAARAVPSCPN